MRTKQRRTESLRRREERWQREDEANRLAEEVPKLSSLSIEILEQSTESAQPPTRYVRRVPVESAPALFEIPCSEQKCEDGGYDITRAVMNGLRSGETHFEGTINCSGSLPEQLCSRSLRWIVKASYVAQRADAA